MLTAVPLQLGGELIMRNIVTFFPRVIWAAVVLAGGVLLARWVGGRAEETVYRSQVVANWLAEPAETGTRVLLYYFAATIALAELGVNTSVLVVFLDGIAFGIGAGAALVVGISLGWGSSDYVSDRVESWLDAVRADEDEQPPAEYREPQGGQQQGGEAQQPPASEEPSEPNEPDVSDDGDETSEE